LLDVVGKVFAKIVQGRLNLVAEKLLPDTQYGFRKNRGCVNVIFVARQLLEKSREHDESLYILFVDLHKVYGSVLRRPLWKVLERSGVPSKMVRIV